MNRNDMRFSAGRTGSRPARIPFARFMVFLRAAAAAAVVSVLFAHPPGARAGGPLLVDNGRSVVWPSRSMPIPFTVDRGNLGPFNNATASGLIRDAFRAWERVATADIDFRNGGSVMPVDVTGNNYLNFLDDLSINPILFDDDGSIVDALHGSGSRFSILGLTFVESMGGSITGGIVILNGRILEENPSVFGRDEYFTTVVHETGHLCGLDHAQHSRQLANNFIGHDDRYLSILYPLSSDDEEARSELSFDDEISLSNLYPTNAHRNNTGSIAGVVKGRRRIGRGIEEIPGVNVIARGKADPVSLVSTAVTGTFDEDGGTYLLAGLPPGDYEVMIEAVDSAFFGSSSVGQYADSSSSKSFHTPVLPEYFNLGDADEEPRSLSDIVAVRRGVTSENIDFNADPGNLNQQRYRDEADAYLLTLNSSARGGAEDFREFLLHPAGNEGRIDIVFEFDRVSDHFVELRRETAPDEFETVRLERESREHPVVLGPGGDAPLEGTRYFIRAFNYDIEPTGFTVTVSAGEAFTPTPEPTPAPTEPPVPVPTATATPSDTPTPPPVAADTPTPRPRPTSTPTPVPSPGDLNGDGVVNGTDLFHFSRRWNDAARGDLLRWLEAYSRVPDATGD